MPEETHIEGELLGFSYQGDRSAFAVARLRMGSGEQITVVGPLSHLVPGQQVVLSGVWQDHAQYGRQFRVSSFLVRDPRTLAGMRTYLASGAVKGVGPELARRLVDHFGLETLRVLSEHPERLMEVSGVGPVTVSRIRQAYQVDLGTRQVLAALRGYGVGAAVARRILERYGQDGLALVAREPYRLVREVPGVGFHTADVIARQNGITNDHPMRVEAAVAHVLRVAEDDGHTLLPQDQALDSIRRLDVADGAALEAIRRLVDTGRLYTRATTDPQRRPLQSPYMARLEMDSARQLAELCRRPPRPTLLSAMDAERAVGLALDPEQRRAVEQGLRQGLVVITGGPGTGKTTIVKVFLAAVHLLGERWKLAAPTGRAARRLADTSGHEATTLHRLLEFNFMERGFKRDRSNPLDVDGVLVDECSMVDQRLMSALLQALAPRTRLVLVGDDHQLPSVGAGQVLHDLIESRVVPVVRLRENYRQEEGSGIVVNAHRVDRGEVPASAEKEPVQRDERGPSAAGGAPLRVARDFFIVDRDDALEAQATLMDIVTRRLPRLGFDPMRDVQVLVPMHRGELGTIGLNRLLQGALNPDGPTMERGDRRFRQGDRVIQVRNNYSIGVFNGEVGTIQQVEADSLVVDFDGRQVGLVGDQLDEVELAYAITVHKSQGSEYPAVVLAVHRSHKIMLQRNLLYTGVTRARRFCCLIGSRWAMRMAVAVSGRGDRYTLLVDRLREAAQA